MENLNKRLKKMVKDPSLIPDTINEDSFLSNPRPYMVIIRECLLDIYQAHQEIYDLRFENVKKPSFTRLIKDVLMTKSIRMTKEFKHVLIELYEFFQKHKELATGYSVRRFEQETIIDHVKYIPSWAHYKIPYLSWDYCLDQLLSNSASPLEIMDVKIHNKDKEKHGITIFPLEFEFHLMLSKVSLKDMLTLIVILLIQSKILTELSKERTEALLRKKMLSNAF